MLELRKLNRTDAAAQWEFVTALPADENGFTNPYEGIPLMRIWSVFCRSR